MEYSNKVNNKKEDKTKKEGNTKRPKKFEKKLKFDGSFMELLNLLVKNK